MISSNVLMLLLLLLSTLILCRSTRSERSILPQVENSNIHQISASHGILTAVAGNGICCGIGNGDYNGDEITATTASLRYPHSVRINSPGDIFISDTVNNRIRKIATSTGIITTVAGTGERGYNGDGILATTAMLNWPKSVAFDTFGNIFIADTHNHRIRKIAAATAIITTVAGTGIKGFNMDGIPAINAWLYYPSDVAMDASGDILIADTYNDRIRKVSNIDGIINTFFEAGPQLATDEVTATTTNFSSPNGLAVDASGNVYITTESAFIFKATASTGVITIIAGKSSEVKLFNGDGIAATNAAVGWPQQIAVDTSGNIFFSDAAFNRIRKITASTGIITTVAGSGALVPNISYVEGSNATSAQLHWPSGVAIDKSGSLYICDFWSRVMKVTFTDVMPTTPITRVPTSAFGSTGSRHIVATASAAPVMPPSSSYTALAA